MIYQYTNQHYENSKKKAILNFVSRLHIATLFKSLKTNVEWSLKTLIELMMLVKPKNESYIKAWQEGKRCSIVDACMRCLVAGYINFRMRAMVVSFFTFNLWQDWRELHF
jgi:deoxyribodipyrimidine photo-lyase